MARGRPARAKLAPRTCGGRRRWIGLAPLLLRRPQLRSERGHECARLQRHRSMTDRDIKARADIVDIVGRYADLKKRGDDLWAKCPLHADSTPSFKVNEAAAVFYCFGCGAKGDVFDFVMAAERVDLPTAIERVLELVGGGRPDPAAEAARAARRAERPPRRPRTPPGAPHGPADPGRVRAADAAPGRLAVEYLVERRGITRWQPTRCAGTRAALGNAARPAASWCRSRTRPATSPQSGASSPSWRARSSGRGSGR